MNEMLRGMHAKQQHYVDCIERLRGGAVARITEDKLYSLLNDLTEGLPLALHPVKPAAKVARGRVLASAQKFESIRTLAYPSKEQCSSFGRCNRPGSPMLYAGVGTELVLSEIGAKQGDIVGLLHMSPDTDILCVRLGALNLWRRTSGHCLMHDKTKASISEIYKDPHNIVAFLFDAFVSDYFARRGNENVYKLTSTYADIIFEANPIISGLIYDSVDHEAGSCLALKPIIFDTIMRPTEVQIVQVTSYLGYGIFDFKELALAKKFDGEKIVWD